MRLAQEFPNIVAIKEAGGSVERVSALRAALPRAFTILSGDDSLTLPFMSAGAVGVISVASNLIPAKSARSSAPRSPDDFAKARELHFQLYPLFKDLFIEPNPVPDRNTRSRSRGHDAADVRLPLCEMAPASAAQARSHPAQPQPHLRK